MRPIWGHREFMHTDCHFILKENNLHFTTTPPVCPFIHCLTFVCFHTTGSLGWRHYLFLPCMVPNMLLVLKINSSNTGSLSCNLSPGNLYSIQESQFFFPDTICAIWGGIVLIPSMCVKIALAKKVFMLALNLISHTLFHTDVTVFFSTVALHTEPSPSDPPWARGEIWTIVSWANVNKTYVTLFLIFFFNNRCWSFGITFQTPASYFPWCLKKFAIFYYSVSYPVH